MILIVIAAVAAAAAALLTNNLTQQKNKTRFFDSNRTREDGCPGPADVLVDQPKIETRNKYCFHSILQLSIRTQTCSLSSCDQSEHEIRQFDILRSREDMESGDIFVQ